MKDVMSFVLKKNSQESHFFSEKRSFRAKIAFFDDMVICVTKVYFSVQMTQLRQTFSVKYFYFFCEIDVFYKIKIHYCPHLYNGKDRRRLWGPNVGSQNEGENTGQLAATLSVQ